MSRGQRDRRPSPDSIDIDIDFDHPRVQREWQAQERAVREERLGLPLARGDDADGARVAGYRLLARALRHPPLERPPADFAAQVARHVQAGPAFEERVERWLLRALLAVLALAAVGVAALYGAAWWPALAAFPQALPAGAGAWASALLACLALSWLLQGLLRQLGEQARAPA